MIEIHPYESVGPVAFGVSADRVLEAFGEPAATSKDRRGNLVMRFQGLSVTIAESGVVEFGLLPESSPRIFGIDIFASPNAFHGLCEKDGSPREFVGFVVLLNLGITMTGFHDGQSEQFAVTAFAKGRWDELQSEMKPFAAR